MKKITFFVLLLFLAITNLRAQVQVGNGTETDVSLPFEPNYGYSYGQSIYLASEIGAFGTITSLQWYYAGSGTMPNSAITLYLGHTTKSSFVDEVDWISFTGLTEVYVGSIPTNSAPGWVTITFDTPFVYNGTDNLVVATHEGKTNYDNFDDDFYNFSVTGDRSLVYYNDQVNPDPASPPADPDFNNLTSYVPNVIFGGITQSCPTPLNLTTTNITTTSATVSWNAPTTAPSGGSSYFISTTNTSPTAATVPTGSVASGNSVSLSSLTPATTYYVWVRNNCGTGSSAWSYNTSFITLCVPTTSFSEDFESPTQGALPTCWSKILRGPSLSESASVETVTFGIINGGVSVDLYNSDSDTTVDDIMLVSPALTSLSSGLYRLKFNAKTLVFFGSGTGSIQIGTLNNNTNTAVFTPFSTVNITNQAAQYIVDFSTYTGTNQYIAFRMNDNDTYKDTILDDIVWELLPLCPDVTGITANTITTTSASFTWTAGGNETQWNAVIAPSTEVNPNNGTPVSATATNTSFSTLTPNTTYKVWVRSVCAGGVNGNWIGPITFTTLCDATNVPYLQDFESATVPALPSCSVIQNAGTGNNWTTSFPDDYGFTSNALTYKFNSTNPANAWYFTQGLNLTAGTTYEISYKYGNNDDFQYSEKLKVKCGTSPNQASMTTALADHPNINTATAQTNSVSFTPATTGVYYFGFNAYSAADQYYLFVDDISVTVSLSNDTFTNTTLNYYPNPVKDMFNLSYSQNISKVEIINLLGQQVLSQSMNANQTQIDMSGLNSGAYLVRVTSEGQVKTIKVIKE